MLRRHFLPLIGAAVAARAEDPPPRNRVILGGDVMLSRNVAARARTALDPAAPFRDLAGLLASADIAFVNLESPFSDQGPVMQRGMVFKTEPEMVAGLSLAGIDVVSTANNHARDRGSYGLEFTLDWLARHGIAVTGTGRSAEEAHAGAVIERNGVRFGFLAYTYDANNGNHKDIDPRIAVLDVPRMQSDVAALRRRVNVLIVSMHAGDEYRPQPNQQQRDFARAAIDAGAQVVAGHHPHVRQPMEWYGGGVIFYSLGNLVFDQFQRTETQIGSLGDLTFEGSRLIRAELRTVNIVGTVPRLAATPSASASESRTK